MAFCSICRRISQKPLQLTVSGRNYQFDSFACALEALAPHCPVCGDFLLHPNAQNGHCERCDARLVTGRVDEHPVRRQVAGLRALSWHSLCLTVGPEEAQPVRALRAGLAAQR